MAQKSGHTEVLAAGLGAQELTLIVLVVLGLLCLVVVTMVLLSRRSGRREAELHQDLHEQRQDIERREHRITEREQRLDNENRALDERAHQVTDAEAALDAKRTELLEVEEERRLILERVAGLTADDNGRGHRDP